MDPDSLVVSRPVGRTGGSNSRVILLKSCSLTAVKVAVVGIATSEEEELRTSRLSNARLVTGFIGSSYHNMRNAANMEDHHHRCSAWDAVHFSSKLEEFFVDMLVAPIDMIEAIDFGRSPGPESSQHQRG